MSQQIFEQATRLHQSGKLNEAEALYRQMIASGGEHPVLMARLGTVLQQTQRPHQALPCLLKAVNGINTDLKLLWQCADLSSQLGEHQHAETCLAQILKLEPENLKAAEQLSGIFTSQGREEEALEMLKGLLKKQPQNANLYNLKGLAQSRLGDTDKGYKSFQKALKLNPSQLGVVQNLITYGKGRKEPLLDQVIPQLEQQLKNPALNDIQKMNIAYVLFMYFEKKSPKKAFGYLKSGNDINRRSYQYDPKETEALFSRIKELFLVDVESSSSAVEGSSQPIFILGMPRSGTTLIEQILSSHSMVNDEGELEDLRICFEKDGSSVLGTSDQTLIQQAMGRVKANYFDRVATRQTTKFFTDKMPYNFMLVGVIATTMPEAKIIHCVRDPIETCYSIYKQNFSGSHAYTNELVELGHYFNCYRDMMKFWEERYPGRIYRADYETMVGDSESQIHSLLEFCDLDMEDACLAFYKSKRAVRTASVAQVRQPIYKDALKASAPVREELAPLIEELARFDG